MRRWVTLLPPRVRIKPPAQTYKVLTDISDLRTFPRSLFALQLLHLLQLCICRRMPLLAARLCLKPMAQRDGVIAELRDLRAFLGQPFTPS